MVISGNRLPHEASWYMHGYFSSTYSSHGCGKRWALRATVVQNSKNYVLYPEYTFHVKYKSIPIGEGITFYLIKKKDNPFRSLTEQCEEALH